MNYEDEIEQVVTFDYSEEDIIYDVPTEKQRDGKTFMWEYAHESCTPGSVFKRNMPNID